MSGSETGTGLDRAASVLIDSLEDARRELEEEAPALSSRQVGRVISVGRATVRVEGLPGAGSEELVLFRGGVRGFVFNLDEEEIGVVLLDRSEDIEAGGEVRRGERVVSVPVGEGVVGRLIDPLGRPLDGRGSVEADEVRSIEADAPAILDRDPVSQPLQTGITSIDALIPIGRGQRELILGDRQTGKTAIAVDTMINQKGEDMICIYCAIGQRSSSLASVRADLEERGAMEYTVMMITTGDDSPGLRYVAPYAATSIAEYFMEKGRDVLVVYDDLTRHAWAYRELSLLLRRPPAREAYPGDIFYIHSRLLERATHLNEERGGGSITALPIVETQAQNISAYIPTNLISITDGQIYLSPELFQKGILPAVDIGQSVSRVGGKTQLPAYRKAAGDLKLTYSQFEELESFARFGTRLDEETRRTLERGRRIRETLKQPQYSPRPVPVQVVELIAVSGGVFDDVPLERTGDAKKRIEEAVEERLTEIGEKILAGEELGDEERERVLEAARDAVADLREGGENDEDSEGPEEEDKERR